MRVERVVLHHVGPFEDLDLTFPAGTDDTRADVHLLVGENGTGKSSVLATIAQVFGIKDAGFLKRTWGDARSRALIVFDSSSPAGVAYGTGGSKQDIDVGAGLRRMPAPHQFSGLAFTEPNRFQPSILTAAQLRASPVQDALFAYGSLRAATDDQVTGVQEQPENPLAEANLFVRPGGARPLVQWIANSYARSAIYDKQGKDTEAAAASAPLRSLEDAIASVVGEERVSFVVEVDPFAVRVAVGPRPPIAFSALPDGVQSLLSWIGDLFMRLDRIPWATAMSPTERAFVLLLDEVEVHLHPRWQRAVLPMAERLFPHAQIIASTHSPFVIGSASDAWIHRFREVDGRVIVDPPVRGPQGQSSAEILRDLMGLPTDFDEESERHLEALKAAIGRRLQGDSAAQGDVDREARWLGDRSVELAVIVQHELRQLRRQLPTAAAK